MHTVEKTGTYVSKDKTKSTQFNAGDQIDEADAADYGMISEKDAEKSAEAPAEQKAVTSAPENKAK